MFEIIENDFVNSGVIKYKDEYGNLATVRRKDDKAVLKCKLTLEHTSVAPYMIDCNDRGRNLDFVFDKRYSGSEILQNTLQNITTLIQDWVDILRALKFLYMPPDLIAKMYGYTASDKQEFASKKKIEQIGTHREFEGIVRALLEGGK